MENVWEFLRGNWLSHRVWDTYEAILDACQDAWNKLMQSPERIASPPAASGQNRSPNRPWIRGSLTRAGQRARRCLTSGPVE